MAKNILVPLDGSPVAASALPYAQALAARTGARLTLVRAAHPAQPLADFAVQRRAIAAAEEYLATESEQLNILGFEVETGVPFGGAARWILEEIDLRHADLVVMATHDRLGLDRWMHGSVAEAVVGGASVPVLVVGPKHGAELAQRFNDEHPVLVVPLDGSGLAEAALPLATALAASLGAHVELVGVVPGPGDLVAAPGGIASYVGDDFERLRSDAHDYLARTARWLTAAGLSATASLSLGAPAQYIAAAAEEHKAAAVVMATHGRTGLARSMLGSVAGETLHHSPCPVMLIRPATIRSAEQPLRSQAVAIPSGA